MVSLDSIIPILVTGIVSFGVGYFVHQLRVKREDSKEDRDQIMGPLLADISANIQGMEEHWSPHYVPDPLSSIRSLAERGRLNHSRLSGLRNDWTALEVGHERMVRVFQSMIRWANESIDTMLRERVNLNIVQQPGGGLGDFPYGNFKVDSRLESFVAKDWDALVREYQRLSRPKQYDITKVVNWKSFWNEQRARFESLVEDYQRHRAKYLTDLKAVKDRLERWTQNPYRRYKSALD